MRRASAGIAEQHAPMERLRAAARDADAIVFTGMGSSYDACYSPVTQLASQGVRTSMVDSAELLHFRLASVGAGTLLVAVSQSGESAELVRLTEALTARPAPGRPVLLSVTNGVGNTLARAADIALDTRAGEEHGPSTMTFAAALVALCAVAGDGVGAAAAADALDELLESPEEDAAGLVEWFGDRPVLALLGRGKVDGVFCVTDLLALGFMDAARHDRRRHIPDDLSVIGFDDIPQAAWDSYRLTTFRQPVSALAQAVTRALMHRADDPRAPDRLATVPVELIVRGTVRGMDAGMTG